MSNLTHADLVERAANWLKRTHTVVITEMATTAYEIPDAIGWRSGLSTLIECKVSRADFFSDFKKRQRLFHNSMGAYRWYLTPPGLVTVEEVPIGWGLLELRGSRIYRVRASLAFDPNYQEEIKLLQSAICRIGQDCPTGISVRFYTDQTKRTATLSIETENPEEP